jgi:hypothetical protein
MHPFQFLNIAPRARFFLSRTALALLLTLSPARAAQMEDGQDYPAAINTPGSGRSPWLVASSGAATSSSTSYIGIYSNNLTGTTIPALASLTNSTYPEAHLQISKAGSSSRTYYRSIGTAITNGSAYCSFLMNVAINPSTSDEILCELIPAVTGTNYAANPTANDPLTLHAKQDWDTNHFKLGIQSLGGTVAWSATNYTVNTDYLVVLGYTFGSGQPGQVFINPLPGAAQPVASASATKGSAPEPANIGTVLFWESAAATSGTFNYDVMRVDASWANATPATNSPAPTNNVSPALRALFLGNSLLGISSSYSNNIPAILSELATNLGDAFVWDRVANGGWELLDHATNAASTNAINTSNYDLVVLQEQSDNPSQASVRTARMFPACRTLNTLATNHGERTVFYESWGYLNGDTTSHCMNYTIPPQYKDCDGGFGSFSAMNIATREGYSLIANELGAAISPVGLAWARVRTERTNLNLYILDDSLGDRHPNSCGAYLAACVFYSAFFGRSPEGSTYYSTNSPGDAQYLQRIAAETVLEDPFAADAYGFATNHYYWAYNWRNFTNPPTAPQNTLVISGASGTPSPSVKVDSAAAGVSNVWLGILDTNSHKSGQGRLYLSTNGSLTVSGALVAGREGKGFVRQTGGALSVPGMITLGESTNSAGQYTLSNGTVYAAQILAGAGSAAFLFQAGQLGFRQYGSALRPLNLHNAAGTLTFTNTAGPAQLFGNFTNGTNATLTMTLGSSANGLEISGSALLSGTLQLKYAPGFNPAPGQQFNVVTAAARAGNFSQILLPAVSAAGLGLSTSLTATSVVASVISYAPALAVTGITTNGLFSFTVNGVTGQNYAVQASTNLAPANWVPVSTNPAPILFIETNRSLPQRFYRAIYLP